MALEVLQDSADGGSRWRAGGAERHREGDGYQSCAEANLAGCGDRLCLGMINDGGVKSVRWNHKRGQVWGEVGQ